MTALRAAAREHTQRLVLDRAVARRRGMARALRPFERRGVVAVLAAKQPPAARGWMREKRDGWWFFTRAVPA